MSKFRVGDRVIGITDAMILGKTGTIRFIDGFSIGVEFDENIGGHNGGIYFKCRDGYGLFVARFDIKHLHAQKIIITTDGKTTLARLYDGNKVVKSAEAKCSQSDTFDFVVGAKLAFERLTKPAEQPKEPVKLKEYGLGLKGE